MIKILIIMLFLFLSNVFAYINDNVSMYLNFRFDTKENQCIKVDFKEKKEILVGLKNDDKLIADFSNGRSGGIIKIEDEKGSITYYQYNGNCGK